MKTNFEKRWVFVCLVLFHQHSRWFFISHPLRAEQVKVIIKKTHKRVFFYGASLGIRTPDLCIRSALLYPAELMTQAYHKDYYTVKI